MEFKSRDRINEKFWRQEKTRALSSISLNSESCLVSQKSIRGMYLVKVVIYWNISME